MTGRSESNYWLYFVLMLLGPSVVVALLTQIEGRDPNTFTPEELEMLGAEHAVLPGRAQKARPAAPPPPPPGYTAPRPLLSPALAAAGCGASVLVISAFGGWFLFRSERS